MPDRRPRRPFTAESMGLAIGGTIDLLLLGYAQGILSQVDYPETIDALADTGFRMSATLYREARAVGESVGE